MDLFQGGKGIASCFPIWRDGRLIGCVIGVFRIEAIEPFLGTPRAMSYAWRIDADQPATAPLPVGARRLPIPPLDRTLTVGFAERAHTGVDEFPLQGLALGIVFSLFCAVLASIGLNARYTAARDEAMLSSILTAAPDAMISLDENGETFPIMVQPAKSQFEDERLMTAILRDMTDIERINSELVSLADIRARKAERAEATNHSKTMFLATMNHELRTLLNAIIGISDIAVREMFGTEDFDVCDLLSSTSGQLMPLMDTKDLVFRSEFPERLITHADPRATRQIVVSLPSNSIKFADPGGVVALSAGPSSDTAFIDFSVQDTGRGIAWDDLGRVGRPFVQVGDACRSEFRGSGLGLAKSRTFSAEMGGNLRIESEIGHVTKVAVSLPAVLDNVLRTSHRSANDTHPSI